jgi:hypothetical protein
VTRLSSHGDVPVEVESLLFTRPPAASSVAAIPARAECPGRAGASWGERAYDYSHGVTTFQRVPWLASAGSRQSGITSSPNILIVSRASSGSMPG